MRSRIRAYHVLEPLNELVPYHGQRQALALMLSLRVSGLAGCTGAAIPRLTSPDLALSTSLLGSRKTFPAGAGHASPGLPVARPTAYTLDSGDRVRILVFGQQNLSNVYNVSAAGTVAVPQIGQVRARGLTSAELARRVAAKLGRELIKDPQVTVEVVAYRPFYILGQVGRPGQYPYVQGLTVENAVPIAEGYKPLAKKRLVQLSRKFDGVVSTLKVPTDYPVQPGDTIYVLRRLF